MSAIDTVRTDDPRGDATGQDEATDRDEEPSRKTLDVSEVDPGRVTAYARATADEGHLELYFERKGGRTYLVAR